jgi:diaminopimelate decarboxylase
VSFFSQRNGELHAEDVALSRVAAEFGTPCYVYSRAMTVPSVHDRT